MLLEGFFHQEDLPILLANNFQTIIHDEIQLKMLESAQLDAPLNCWLKINTGMHRLGIAPEQFDIFVAYPLGCNIGMNLKMVGSLVQSTIQIGRAHV